MLDAHVLESMERGKGQTFTALKLWPYLHSRLCLRWSKSSDEEETLLGLVVGSVNIKTSLSGAGIGNSVGFVTFLTQKRSNHGFQKTSNFWDEMRNGKKTPSWKFIDKKKLCKMIKIVFMNSHWAGSAGIDVN